MLRACSIQPLRERLFHLFSAPPLSLDDSGEGLFQRFSSLFMACLSQLLSQKSKCPMDLHSNRCCRGPENLRRLPVFEPLEANHYQRCPKLRRKRQDRLVYPPAFLSLNRGFQRLRFAMRDLFEHLRTELDLLPPVAQVVAELVRGYGIDPGLQRRSCLKISQPLEYRKKGLLQQILGRRSGRTTSSVDSWSLGRTSASSRTPQ